MLAARGRALSCCWGTRIGAAIYTEGKIHTTYPTSVDAQKILHGVLLFVMTQQNSFLDINPHLLLDVRNLEINSRFFATSKIVPSKQSVVTSGGIFGASKLIVMAALRQFIVSVISS